MVLVLHALIWFALAGHRQAEDQPASNITYADLRFVTPKPVAQPSATPAPAPVAVRIKPRVQARPRQITEVRDSAPEAPAAQAAELLPLAEVANAPAVPAINLEALRTAARENERGRERSPIEKHRDELRRDQHRDRAAEAIARTARADCRSAHANLGILALIPIVIDTVRDKGCKW